MCRKELIIHKLFIRKRYVLIDGASSSENEIDGASSSEDESMSDSDNDGSFDITDYEWVPDTATEEDSEEEETFDFETFLELMDRQIVHESPMSSPPAPAPNQETPVSPPPTASPPFDVIAYLMASPKKEKDSKKEEAQHCPTCTCFKH